MSGLNPTGFSLGAHLFRYLSAQNGKTVFEIVLNGTGFIRCGGRKTSVSANDSYQGMTSVLTFPHRFSPSAPSGNSRNPTVNWKQAQYVRLNQLQPRTETFGHFAGSGPCPCYLRLLAFQRLDGHHACPASWIDRANSAATHEAARQFRHRVRRIAAES
jgi:hypothetical protein